MTRHLHLALAVLLSLSALACESEGEGLTEREVCERYLTSVDGSMRHEGRNGVVVSPPEAVQHRRTAQEVLEFARWAKAAEDASLVETAERLEEQAERTLSELRVEDDDAVAEHVSAPLYEETAPLYYRCAASLTESLMESP